MTPNQCLIFVLMAGVAGFVFGMLLGSTIAGRRS